ncbi:MAG: tRNA pseudouridine(55) synthase TruB [Rhodocyclaceae bacterium]|nr:tRNA pseudouridine(55) synthase TruB [Rhodocyclaceae bacterium]
MNRPQRPPRRRIDGVLLLDKPGGMTSNAALQKARWLFNAAKAGHTGTLDPMATGLLPLCLGEATKFAGELLDADKAYEATLRLGVTTDTADAEGTVLLTRPVAVARDQAEAALARFRGAIDQVPPMHSALKRDGRPLYEYARRGIEVERAPRRVVVHALELRCLEGERLDIAVACSKGTYVRTLAQDIGEVLGCGAHLAALRRTRIGRLRLADAVTLESIEALPPESRHGLLQPADALLADLPRLDLDEAEALRLCQGQALRRGPESAGRVRLYGPDGGFLGVGRRDGAGLLAPLRLVMSVIEK